MRELSWKPFEMPSDTSADLSRGCVVVIGVFDGVHRGHWQLICGACEDAQRRGLPCVVLTFDPDPTEVLQPVAPSLRILGTRDRVAGLYAAGANEVMALSFTPELSKLEPREFVQGVIVARLHPQSVHVGSNFRFGRGGAGTPQTLSALGKEFGFEVYTHDLLQVGGGTVSSTRIRELLQTDDGLEAANELLGRCHYIRGTVAHGRGEGTAFGFPTANVVSDVRDCMPAEGVYACYVCCEGKAWPAAANVGAPPTFSARKPAFLEANLIGFEGDLYGKEVTVSFVKWLRPSRKFDSFEELKRTVLGNIAWVKENLRVG